MEMHARQPIDGGNPSGGRSSSVGGLTLWWVNSPPETAPHRVDGDPPDMVSIGPGVTLISARLLMSEWGLTREQLLTTLEWLNNTFAKERPKWPSPILPGMVVGGVLRLNLLALVQAVHLLTCPGVSLSELMVLAGRVGGSMRASARTTVRFVGEQLAPAIASGKIRLPKRDPRVVKFKASPIPMEGLSTI